MFYDGVDGKIEEVQITKSKKLIIREVFYAGKEYLDLRFWVRFRGSEDYNPTKQGIFMLKSNMQSVNTIITKMLNP